VPDDDPLRVTRSLSIPAGELTWRFTASGGPGGQHANTANTKAEVHFDIAASPSLGPRQRERLLARFGPELRVVASGTRSQGRNRAEARQRLAELLAGALHVERSRVATRPGKAAVERRLDAKHRRSDIKRDRRRRYDQDG
jgi:ribosome-associated protein